MATKRKSKTATRETTAKPRRRPAMQDQPKPNATQPRIARVAKGKRPQYFSDPAIDKLLWITLTLCEELSVTRDRLDTVERLLDKRRVIAVNDIEQYEPDAKTEALREQRRADYIDRVLRAVSAELEELTGRGASSMEEAVAAVES